MGTPGSNVSVQAPVHNPSAVSSQHVKRTRRVEADWNVFDKCFWPGDTFRDQPGFALRHENLGLLVPKRIFDAASPSTMEEHVENASTSVQSAFAGFGEE